MKIVWMYVFVIPIAISVMNVSVLEKKPIVLGILPVDIQKVCIIRGFVIRENTFLLV
jgi:hypothetical protein